MCGERDGTPREVPWKGKLASGFGDPEAVPEGQRCLQRADK